ncbi:MAG: 50S ribosomal protein L23 [Candidatus Pacebacteria bacterium]|nr:50S ribosomal protein L23 [Candidatus Paceibacterota bacterium]
MSALNIFKTKKAATKSKTVAKVKATKEVKVEAAPVVANTSNLIISKVSAILHPYVSEKASRLETMNQYMFKVTRDANKPEVKKAIENRYKVKVVAVNMINMPSKKRTVGRHIGTKAGFRKAIVTLAEGDSINSAKA